MSRWAPLVLALVTAARAAAGAGETPEPPARPKSPQAGAAIRKRDKAVEEAERAYRAALLAAERQAAEDLKAARAAAMKGDNLPEANAIDAGIRVAQARVDRGSVGEFRKHEAGLVRLSSSGGPRR
jgi:hypothetical protein